MCYASPGVYMCMHVHVCICVSLETSWCIVTVFTPYLWRWEGGREEDPHASWLSSGKGK